MPLKMTGVIVATLVGLATLTFSSAMSAGAMGSVLDLSCLLYTSDAADE